MSEFKIPPSINNTPQQSLGITQDLSASDSGNAINLSQAPPEAISTKEHKVPIQEAKGGSTSKIAAGACHAFNNTVIRGLASCFTIPACAFGGAIVVGVIDAKAAKDKAYKEVTSKNYSSRSGIKNPITKAVVKTSLYQNGYILGATVLKGCSGLSSGLVRGMKMGRDEASSLSAGIDRAINRAFPLDPKG